MESVSEDTMNDNKEGFEGYRHQQREESLLFCIFLLGNIHLAVGGLAVGVDHVFALDEVAYLLYVS